MPVMKWIAEDGTQFDVEEDAVAYEGRNLERETAVAEFVASLSRNLDYYVEPSQVKLFANKLPEIAPSLTKLYEAFHGEVEAKKGFFSWKDVFGVKK